MTYEVSFGTLGAGLRAEPGQVFRVALLGDFSGRAGAGVVETGSRLAARKPLKVDVDSLDDVLARLSPTITVTLGDEGTVSIPIAAMDDFHPDQLVEALPLFERLRQLRRDVQSRAGFERAMREVMSWAGAEPLPPPSSRRPRGGTIATDRRLSDFARLTGRATLDEASADDLVRRLIGPFVVPATDSRQDALLKRVDTALADAMRRILHHPEFQSAEALWRGVEMLVRGLETGARLQIVLYDVTAEELAADLAGTDALQDTALYAMLVEQPAQDANAGPLSFMAGLYQFELSPPHADLLGRMAQLAARAGAPFVAGIGADALREPEHEWHPLVRASWAELRGLSASAYLGLATPRFLLRMPYGRKTDPIDAFGFEEFTRQAGLSGMLWGHPAVLVALLVGLSWSKGGRAMKLGSHTVVGDLPVYVYHDADGDQVALPCTERLFSEREATRVASVGVIPVVSLRGRPEVRVAGFASVAGPDLAGRWAPVETVPPKPAKVREPKAPKPAKVAAPPPPAPPAAADLADLDALLADLGTMAEPPAAAAVPPAPAPVPVAAAPPPAPEAPGAEPADADLDALLASLGAEPPPAAADETDADLDALLASLK